MLPLTLPAVLALTVLVGLCCLIGFPCVVLAQLALELVADRRRERAAIRDRLRRYVSAGV